MAGKMLDAQQGKILNDKISNLITVGSYRNAVIINTNPTVTFSDGNSNISTVDFSELTGKTMVNAIAQLKSASSTIITSCRILDSTTIQIKCMNIYGSPYSGSIPVSIIIFAV